MNREACPRCGGKLATEEERWSGTDRTVRRTVRCEACGGRFETTADSAGNRAGSVGAGSAGARSRSPRAAVPLLWIVAALVVLWGALRSIPYGGRSAIYRAVYHGAAAVFEAFLHPAWLGALLALAVALVVWRWRGMERAQPLRAAMTPDVHLRAEPPGKLTAMIADSRGASGRDFVSARNPEAEAAILTAFDELARRSLAFGAAAPGRDEIADWQRRVYSLGVGLGDALLGEDSEARGRIADLPGDHLLLRLQPELARFPWELMVPRPGGQFLWQLFNTSRQIRDELGAPPNRSRRPGPLRLLLLANLEAGSPGRELPDAEREAALLLDLAAERPDLLRAERKSPRSARELKLLLTEGFDVVHFASHTSHTEGRTGWVLGDGEAVSPDDLGSRPDVPPLLVFANSCGSGADTGLEESGSADTARQFLRWGVPAYLGTLWELHDAGSASFARAFYRELAGGATLGGAVTAARAALLGAHPITWANYVLYGDPALNLASPGAVPNRP